MKNSSIMRVSVIVGFCLAFGSDIPIKTQYNSNSIIAVQNVRGATTRAAGTFDVKLTPQDDKSEDTTRGRMLINKQFHGDLRAVSEGQMLTAMTPIRDSAGYVAIEKVTGTLHGRKGSFMLQHSGTMTRGEQQLALTVVPDSGNDELAGLAGRMTIRIADGKHHYEFDYTLQSASPQPPPGQQVARGGGQQPMPPGPNPNSQYRLGPDSLAQEGVPKGEIRGPYTLPSNVYPGTQHTYWVYVPAQYDPAVPAALMVYQDGQAFKDENGDIRAQNVMDNLIYRREIPVMIGVFINPGRTPEQPEPTPQNWGDRTTNRPTEYNTLDDKYARVITEELLPVLYKEYNISKDPEMHGIGGSSSGAIAAFTVAWERPNHFRKVLSNVGSFVNLRGGHVYPELVLASEKKPIRVYLCDGRNDNRGIRNGVYDEKRDWFYQNVRLMKALTQKGYDVNYSWSMNLHGQKYGGAIMPEMMRWLWRDGPVSTDPNDMIERSFRQPAARKN
ncbi:MAG: DUF3224 domain-containing protein [Acidobacteria bacterium]|nr:DUF3224 domain-containing protein [Acidobacteriota bacterium]